MKNSISRRTFLAGVSAVRLASGGRGLKRQSARAATMPSFSPTAQSAFAMRQQGRKIPVVLDTDIGGDIDDTWALAMLLKSPELDIKLVTSDSGNDVYRARLIAKMLEVADRTDVPVGIGCKPGNEKGRQSTWLGDYKLDDYPGKVHEDGVGSIIHTIRASNDPITLVAIGPVPNIAEVVRRAPDVAQKTRFVGMHGSIYRGYGGSSDVSAEYNVRAAPEALQAVFAADWEIALTPLDTCGIVHLEGDKYQKVYRCQDPVVRALIQNYRAWCAARDGNAPNPAKRSSILFDTVAVYMAFSEQLLEMEELPLRVDDQGYTRIHEAGRKVRCATRWNNLAAFQDELVRRLTS